MLKTSHNKAAGSVCNVDDYYIGVMSGTSCDGIDLALVDFSKQQPQLISKHYSPYDDQLRAQLLASTQAQQSSLIEIGHLDARLGELIAELCLEALAANHLRTDQITAIGSHGHTLYHEPDTAPRFSWQIGDPNRIAQLTGITTIADFRRADIAVGGQGAPLVPAFHRAIFATAEENRAIANIGGIANLTLLPTADTVSGFDTGPGNGLMDYWCQRHIGTRYDQEGNWAKSGQCIPHLLSQLLSDSYLQRRPPKSTGKEHYNSAWLHAQLKLAKCDTALAADVQASLCAFTAQSILQTLKNSMPEVDRLLVCGGGAHNKTLMEQLNLSGLKTESTAHHGIDPDFVEAMAFAWLAQEHLAGRPGNLPAVTGAKKPVVLGGIYRAT